MDPQTHERGREIRTRVLGAEYVERAAANADEFSQPLQDLVTEYCWGAVWGRDGLPPKSRSMITLAMIATLNRPQELATHIKGALRNGVTRDEIREIESGVLDRQDNPLKHAPHPQLRVIADSWEHGYGREKAVFPAPWVRANKFWPSVGRVESAYGDRNLVCSCVPTEAYAE